MDFHFINNNSVKKKKSPSFTKVFHYTDEKYK